VHSSFLETLCLASATLLAATAVRAEPPAPAAVSPPVLASAPSNRAPDGMRPSSVLLELSIDREGRVESAVVIAATGVPLEAVAVERAQRLVFQPARRNDVPIAARIRFRFDFVAPPAPAPSVEPTPKAPPTPTPGAETKPATTPEETEPELVFEAEARVEAPAHEATRHTIDEEALTEVAGTRGDALRAIEVLPGVSRPANGDGAPILRGASSFESTVFLNGSTIPLLYHFQSLTSTFNSHLLERVDVYPSNFSVRYGRFFGGVVVARTRPPRRDGLHGWLDVSLLDSSLGVEAPVGRATGVALAARRSNIDLYFDQVVGSGDFGVVAAPLYWDYQGSVVHDLSRHHELSVTAYGSRDSLELYFDHPVQSDPAIRGDLSGAIEFHQVELALESHLGPRVEQASSLTFGRTLLRQVVGPEMDATLRSWTLAGRSEWRMQVEDSLSLTTGIDVESTFFDGTYRGSRPPQLEGDPNIQSPETNTARVEVRATKAFANPALYLESEWLPVPEVSVIPGLRLDYFQLDHALVLDPRLAVRGRVTDHTTLKAGVGLFSQAPLYYEMLPEIGNPELQPARALHVSAGVEQRIGRDVEIGAELFAKRLTHRIVATPGGRPPYFENDGIGRIAGLELSGRARLGSGSFAYAAYTLSRSERRDRGDAWRLFDYDQTHNLVMAASHALGSGWRVGLRFRLVSGNPETPITGSVLDTNTGLYRPLYGAVNSERNPTFYQLDLSAEKAWQLPGWKLTAYVDVQNATNATNAEGRRHSFDYRQSEPVRGLPIFPNLGLRGEL